MSNTTPSLAVPVRVANRLGALRRAALRSRAVPIVAILAAACLLVPSARILAAKPAVSSGPLVVLSTTDLKGKTGPCGCHTPKGGLARLASFADSVHAQYTHVLLVDNGGFFPEADDYEDVAAFVLESHRLLNADAVGVSEKELRYGRGFLLAGARRTGVPLVCANLVDKTTNKLLVAPYVLRRAGGATVGIFGLTADKIDLGAARDSVTVEDPTAASKRTIEQLRAKGATVIVLLSSLGRVETEDLVTAVDGIDLAIAGRNVPLMQKGRLVKNTMVCYGGEQGQYAGRTLLTLDAAGHVTQSDNETFMLGPEVGDEPHVLALVKAFEDKSGAARRQRDKARAAELGLGPAGAADSTGEHAADHFLGAEFCQRCHKAEYDQWKTTRHAQAWTTLVDANAQGKALCVPCHVTGYRQAGGFKDDNDAQRFGGVQCESCHGMGTSHEAFAKVKTPVAEATCRTCHSPKTSPDFAMGRFRPYVDHAKLTADLPALDVRRPMRAERTGGK